MLLNPLDWPGPPFLALYLVVALATLFFCLDMRDQIGNQPLPRLQLTAPQLAYMSGGAGRAGDAVLVELLEAKQASLSDDGKHIMIERSPGGGRSNHGLPGDLEDGPKTRTQFQSLLGTYIKDIEEGLARTGLAPTPGQCSAYRRHVFCVVLIPIIFGLAKVEVGISRGKPVGYLICLIILTVFFGLLLMIKPRLTATGEAALREYKKAHARLARAPIAGEFPMAVALSGLAVLVSTEFAPLYSAAQAHGWAGSAGGGCGSGGGCSGGGGGGGGGCGGCGGGS